MPVIELHDLNHPGAAVFSHLTEAQLRSKVDPEKGIFIAESPKVIRVALPFSVRRSTSTGMPPISSDNVATSLYSLASARCWPT